LALARGKRWLAGKWEDVTRYESFEWDTKRGAMQIEVNDEGRVVTFPLALPAFWPRAKDTNRLSSTDTSILGGNGSSIEIDENMLLEAMPDFTPFLPRE
jgi:hypothetical protein